ncbi:hypothetical protein BC833DRAFT_24123 [Globomyces pollinis-pini]|nr:hypothetical protein BC833DRAFT_24123 [Globomyces pollinis-pini]
MLEFPKLCSEYMTLVSLLIEYFPDRLSQLPSSLLDSLIQSLLFGTQQNFSGISDISFKAIQSLALYAWAESMMTQNDMSYLTTSIDGMLQQIMHALLYQPLDSSILNDAANAIFALSLCKPELFFNILNSILNQHQMIDIINKLYENFSNLSTIQKQKLFDGKFSIGWGSPGLERLPSLNSFRKLFITFVMDSRTTVIIK